MRFFIVLINIDAYIKSHTHTHGHTDRHNQSHTHTYPHTQTNTNMNMNMNMNTLYLHTYTHVLTGTKELGKNIVEGVSGIVVSPLRGWEAGGGVGLGLGVARGIDNIFYFIMT